MHVKSKVLPVWKVSLYKSVTACHCYKQLSFHSLLVFLFGQSSSIYCEKVWSKGDNPSIFFGTFFFRWSDPFLFHIPMNSICLFPTWSCSAEVRDGILYLAIFQWNKILIYNFEFFAILQTHTQSTMQLPKSLSIIGMQLATQHALQSRNVISFYLSSFM